MFESKIFPRLGMVAFFTFLPLTALAASWYDGYTSTVYGSYTAAAAGALNEQNQNSCNVFSTATNNSAYFSAGPTFLSTNADHHRYSYTMACTRVSDGTPFFTFSGLIYADIGDECDLPQIWDDTLKSCITESNCDGSITGTAFMRPVFSGGSTGDICHESSQCVMSAGDITGLNSADLVEYTGTNQNCSSEPEIPVTPADEDAQCVSSGGNTWCSEPNLADENCGMLNGQYLCLDSVPDGGCTFFGDGGMACSSSASSPPAPDDGTNTGTPATPDTTINHNGDTTNIYNAGTTANSAGDTSGTQQGDEPTPPIEAEVDFDEILEPANDPGTGDAIDGMTGDLEAEMDGVIDELTDPEDFVAPDITIDDTIANVLTGQNCTNFVVPSVSYFPGMTWECAELATARDILGWILAMSLALHLYNVVTTRPN